MVFSSAVFLFCFLPVMLILTGICRKNSTRNYILLFGSLLFYAWGEPRYILLMVLSIVVNWGLGIKVSKARKVKWVIAAVIYNLSMLFVFKYLNFAVSNLGLLFGIKEYSFEVALPIGISFYTFQALSYVIDIYRGDGEAQKNPLNVGLYISLFPQLIAGPIVRYQSVAEQIKSREVCANKFNDGVKRFIAGLGKKVLISNNMALIADAAYGRAEGHNLLTVMAWLGAWAYTFQIYYDFSGYSDMAIGLGKMFGFEFQENFNYPYISKSVSEFWRRWHISLGQWFRDYVYIPLGGNRVAVGRLYLNLFFVWFLTGLWHGANWTFVLWGTMYFLLLAIEKTLHMEKWFQTSGIHKCIGIAYTMLWVMIGWVIFRADNLQQAFYYLKTMFVQIRVEEYYEIDYY